VTYLVQYNKQLCKEIRQAEGLGPAVSAKNLQHRETGAFIIQKDRLLITACLECRLFFKRCLRYSNFFI